VVVVTGAHEVLSDHLLLLLQRQHKQNDKDLLDGKIYQLSLTHHNFLT
jgi:hypothetical protein